MKVGVLLPPKARVPDIWHILITWMNRSYRKNSILKTENILCFNAITVKKTDQLMANELQTVESKYRHHSLITE